MKLKIEYGKGVLEREVPYDVTVKGMQYAPLRLDMPEAIEDALSNPIGTAGLLAIAQDKFGQNSQSKAMIVVSDNTRPVPYYGKEGLVFQIIKVLREAGFAKDQITILVGAGSHRNMDEAEIEDMIGLQEMDLADIRVVNHEYDQEDHLTSLGYTEKGSHVVINKEYFQADLKIVTGLVESHFMAGASGGRKGICPAIVGKETLTLFHGAKFLGASNAADLILEGNPLHDEASEIATMAGCDFLVNVTLDNDMKVTGVFAGDMVAAHQAAVAKIKEYVMVTIAKRYDIVVVPAGFVGINHYQAAKAAIEAARAVEEGGKIIIVAKNTDLDPIGGSGYKSALKLLAEHGFEGFMKMISADDWQIIQEQWQVQMWCKVFQQIKKEINLYYCALEIPKTDYAYLPGKAGIDMISEEERLLPADEAMCRMVQRTLVDAIATSHVRDPSILLLKDGPYGVPLVAEE